MHLAGALAGHSMNGKPPHSLGLGTKTGVGPGTTGPTLGGRGVDAGRCASYHCHQGRSRTAAIHVEATQKKGAL